MSKRAVAIFLDTNVLLHYKPLGDIDWRAVAKADAVKLVLCRTVTHEVDKAKYDARLKGRAESALREIRAIREAGGHVREGVTLEFSAAQVRDEDLPPDLDPRHQDTQVVFSVKKYLETHPGEGAAVATGDLGMELQCQAAGVRCHPLGEALRLPPVQDEERRKHREAIRELERLKNRLPDLVIVARLPGETSEEGEYVVELAPEPPLLDVDAEMAKIVRQYPKQAIKDSPMLVATITCGIQPGELIRYNQELDQFHADFRAYLEEENEARERLARTIAFEMVLKNGGTSPASDIDLVLLLPDRFSQITTLEEAKRARPRPPQPPDPPAKGPFPELARNLSRLQQPLIMPRPDLSAISSLGANVSEPGIIRESPFRITLNVQRLKHLTEQSLGAFSAVFNSWEDVRPFEVEYAITAEELPDAARGQVLFLVTRKGSEAQ